MLPEITTSDALLIIDYQNDFLPSCLYTHFRRGSLAVPGGDEINERLLRLCEHFSEKGGVVVATLDYHPRNHCSFLEFGGPYPVHCVQSTFGARLCAPLAAYLDGNPRTIVAYKGIYTHVESLEAISDEHGKGAFVLDTSGPLAASPPDIAAVFTQIPLLKYLRSRGIRRYFLCGLALDYCVLETALALRRVNEQQVYVIEDACAALGNSRKIRDTLATLEAQGVRVITSSLGASSFTQRLYLWWWSWWSSLLDLARALPESRVA